MKILTQRTIGVAMFILGALGFVLCTVSLYFGLPSGGLVELPLSGIADLGVDSKGRIYCAAPFYGRIQRYSPGGVFERGWSVSAAWGLFDVTTDEEDHIVVAAVRTKRVLVFNSNGDLLDTRYIGNSGVVGQNEQRPQGLGRRIEDELRIRHSLLWPQVVSSGPDGTERIIIDTNVFRWILMAPFPAWFLLLVGGIFARRAAKSTRTKPDGVD
jgi:hypothetical protein